MSWLFLILAILFEICATTCLKLSNGWTRLWPTLGMIASYAACFFLLSLALRRIELGVAYAVWSALGIAVLTLIGALCFEESLSPLKLASLALIVAGVVGLNLSGTAVEKPPAGSPAGVERPAERFSPGADARSD